ncbi:MAG: tRNA (adenosine(37)-N6)-dimethylallyltransferase MiaA [Planctomycetota bacterium]
MSPSQLLTNTRPIVVLGNTAGGKSELAVQLAERLDGEVVSADSMQVYRHLNAGTAKPTPDQQARAPHHLIDVADPRHPFTVADWLDLAERALANIQQRGRRPIIVGGTNLYLNALLRGLMHGPAPDPALRAALAARSTHDLHDELAQSDPAAAQRIAPTDRPRLTRALEVLALTGQPISQQQTQWRDDGTTSKPNDARPPIPPPSPLRPPPSPTYRHNPILLGLAWDTDAINHRINKRVRAMFFPEKEPELAAEALPLGESLPHETARLEAAGMLGPQARQALGYKQVLSYLAHRAHKSAAANDTTNPTHPIKPDPTSGGIKSLDDAFERTKVLTRRFGKQQRTWMRRYRDVKWIQMPCGDPLAEAIQGVD